MRLNDSIASAYGARDVLRPPEVIPESLRMVRVDAHRLADPLDAFLGPAEPGQDLALLDDDEVVVGTKLERALLMIERLVEAIEGEVQRREDAMHVRIGFVERRAPCPALS
jgi:hypothetical protein